MIEGLAFFKGTESNGVTRILYSKERMSAQQVMKAEDGKKLIIYFVSVCLGFPPVESFRPVPIWKRTRMGRHRLYTVKIIGKSDHEGTTPIHKGRMLSSGFGIQCSEWHR
ncbi:hypothetical protein [Peribacillus frigoritolerans]|uniref:hypothetical protein n=1 Tax=Peribacillus frigoritolerans TaxID=450367 RepID=UPI0039A00B50